MENVYFVNNEVIEATSIDAMDQCPSQDGSLLSDFNDDVTATGPDIYDFLEAYHESCLAISQEFREFRTKNMVDAMDCHGNWIAATIDSTHYTHPQSTHLLIHSPLLTYSPLLTHSPLLTYSPLLTHLLTLTHSLTYL
jgi:hypothetical protein